MKTDRLASVIAQALAVGASAFLVLYSGTLLVIATHEGRIGTLHCVAFAVSSGATWLAVNLRKP